MSRRLHVRALHVPLHGHPRYKYFNLVKELKVGPNSCVWIEPDSGSVAKILLAVLALRKKPHEARNFVFVDDQNNSHDLHIYWQDDNGKKQIRSIRDRYIGYLSERSRLLSCLTIEENIRLEVTREDRLFEELVEKLFLKPYLRKMPHKVPASQRRAALVARTLMSRPALAIMDNPTAGVPVDLHAGIWTALFSQLPSTGLVVVAPKPEWRDQQTDTGSTAERVTVVQLSPQSHDQGISFTDPKCEGGRA
jgi:ABC-type lipoprotein export system ATPase subunit